LPLYGLSFVVFHALVALGAYGSVVGWGAGAWLLVAAALQLLTVHLAVGIVAYFRTMHRRWPLVLPIDDEDW
jgi:hypothetical protein